MEAVSNGAEVGTPSLLGDSECAGSSDLMRVVPMIRLSVRLLTSAVVVMALGAGGTARACHKCGKAGAACAYAAPGVRAGRAQCQMVPQYQNVVQTVYETI